MGSSYDDLQQLLIPERIKVGYQEREGTYTGKLAYVIYFDNKGVLRKETSWEGWRSKKIEPNVYTNDPTEGFVLNKDVGGGRGWHSRNEYIRVYDPRGFEFEISVANLLFILRESDCSRGKGLEGKFVYSWDRQELVLLPVSSLDYQNSKQYTELKSKKVAAKDLIPGCTYIAQDQRELVYLGRFEYHFIVEMQQDQGKLVVSRKSDAKGMDRRHIFWHNGRFHGRFLPFKDVKTIAILKSDAAHPDYADLVDEYNKSPHGSKAVRLLLQDRGEYKKEDRVPWFYQDADGAFVKCYEDGYDKDRFSTSGKYVIDQEGIFRSLPYWHTTYRPGTRWSGDSEFPWRESTNLSLYVETANGGVHTLVDPEYYWKSQFERDQ